MDALEVLQTKIDFAVDSAMTASNSQDLFRCVFYLEEATKEAKRLAGITAKKEWKQNWIEKE